MIFCKFISVTDVLQIWTQGIVNLMFNTFNLFPSGSLQLKQIINVH